MLPSTDGTARMAHLIPALPGRLAICGWNEGSAALSRALTAGGFTPAAVGDPRAAALVRARTATGLPCAQDIRALLQDVLSDAVLMDTPGLPAFAEDLLVRARRRRTHLLIPGEWLDAEAMTALAGLVRQDQDGCVALTLLRPRLRSAGMLALIEAAAGWRPSWIQIELTGPAEAQHLIGDALALASRLQPASPDTIVATACGAPDAPEALVTHLRGDRHLTALTARTTETPTLTVRVVGPEGAIDLVGQNGEAMLRVAAPGHDVELARLEDSDLLGAEVARAAGHAAHADTHDDRYHLLRETPLRAALERALGSGHAEPVAVATAPTLRVLTGSASGGGATMPRQPRGRLHLVAP